MGGNVDESISRARIISELSSGHTHSTVTFFFGVAACNSVESGGVPWQQWITHGFSFEHLGTLSFPVLYTSEISHGYLTQPYFKRNIGVSFIQAHYLFTLGNHRTWPEMLRDTPSSLEILRFIPWSEQHQDVANAANTSILWPLRCVCQHICHWQQKAFSIRYDRQKFKKEKSTTALWGPTIPYLAPHQQSKSITSYFHIIFPLYSKFVTRIALISIGSLMSLRCKFQQRAFNLSRNLWANFDARIYHPFPGCSWDSRWRLCPWYQLHDNVASTSQPFPTKFRKAKTRHLLNVNCWSLADVSTFHMQIDIVQLSCDMAYWCWMLSRFLFPQPKGAARLLSFEGRAWDCNVLKSFQIKHRKL